MDPLKPPVRPRKQLGESVGVFFLRSHVSQPLGKIVTEQARKDRHLVERRWRVCPDPDIDVTVSAGPFGKQRCGQRTVAPAEPVRGYPDTLRPTLENSIENTDQSDRQALRHLRVGEAPFRGVEIPRRAYLTATGLRPFRRRLRVAIVTGSFSNAMDSTTRARSTRRCIAAPFDGL